MYASVSVSVSACACACGAIFWNQNMIRDALQEFEDLIDKTRDTVMALAARIPEGAFSDLTVRNSLKVSR
jgi:hypothetical protein